MPRISHTEIARVLAFWARGNAFSHRYSSAAEVIDAAEDALEIDFDDQEFDALVAVEMVDALNARAIV